MKILHFALVLNILLTSCRSNIQNSLTNHSNEEKVDSLFKEEFSNIKKTLDNHQVMIKKSDKNFIYLLSYLSGIEVNMKSGYFGDLDFDQRKLLIFENWYNHHKTKIDWKNVQKGLTILSSDDYRQSTMNELKKLRIK